MVHLGILVDSAGLWGKVLVLLFAIGSLIFLVLTPIVVLYNLAHGNYIDAIMGLAIIAILSWLYWKATRDKDKMRKSLYNSLEDIDED